MRLAQRERARESRSERQRGATRTIRSLTVKWLGRPQASDKRRGTTSRSRSPATIVAGGALTGSALAENRLHVVAIRVDHERGIVARRVATGGIPKSGRAVIDSAGFERGRMKRVDLGATPGGEGGVLLHTVRVKAVNPENRVVDAVPNAVDSGALGKLHDPGEAKGAQSRIVKSGRTADVRDSDAGVVDHRPPAERAAGPFGRPAPAARDREPFKDPSADCWTSAARPNLDRPVAPPALHRSGARSYRVAETHSEAGRT